MLAVATGSFPPAALQEQSSKKGMRAMTYRGIDMWFATEKGVLSIARVSDQLVLIGEPKTLEMAVDRSIANSKDYSPLLSRAAKFAQKDLWVVASGLPDDLANRFVPLDTQAEGFEGSVSLKNGLALDAVITTNSEKEAAAAAGSLRQSIPTLPVIVRGLQVTVEDSSILLALTATREQVMASLRQPEVVAPPPEPIKVETPFKVEHIAVDLPVEKVPKAAEKPVDKAAVKPVEKVEKVVEKPQVIRIIGLDEGPREIVLPPVKPDKP